ncbi:Concanavalin A-like lectin glucanase [Cordyceps militaris]|uniref:Concanavalin A-like lectin glucanase n=1 Tax=Cordyceps militaris TaxID=73501 RepID=A0A2H4S8D9_CORMI|nr:Concanavalin A-like lectin glucanase [Cordyceps militaris]
MLRHLQAWGTESVGHTHYIQRASDGFTQIYTLSRLIASISLQSSSYFMMQAKLLSVFATLSLYTLVQARPGSTVASSKDDVSVTSGAPGATVSNALWCGFVEKTAVQTVSAVWTVPNVALPDPNSQGDYEIFQWVGIDGASPSSCNNVLLQGGTSQVFYQGKLTTDFWYEFYNPSQTPSLHVAYPPLSVGDQVRVTVTATSAYAGTILFENLTTGVSDTQKVKSSQPLCFQHVEWITEAPTKLLPNFDAFDFSEVSAVKKDGSSINAAGSDLWYLNTSAATCSAYLSDGGSTITFPQN